MACKRGARPVGVDPTPAQLATARRMQAETGIEFPLVEAPGESVPLPDASFDLALSEYGASLWADPEKWVREASRLLRPGGRLVFLTNSMLVYLCAPEIGVVTEQLQRPQLRDVPHHSGRGRGRSSITCSTATGSRGCARTASSSRRCTSCARHENAVDPGYYDFVTVEWARKWPAEEIWVAKKL